MLLVFGLFFVILIIRLENDVSELAPIVCESLYENVEQFDRKSSFLLPDQFCKFSPQEKKNHWISQMQVTS